MSQGGQNETLRTVPCLMEEHPSGWVRGGKGEAERWLEEGATCASLPAVPTLFLLSPVGSLTLLPSASICFIFCEDFLSGTPQVGHALGGPSALKTLP